MPLGAIVWPPWRAGARRHGASTKEKLLENFIFVGLSFAWPEGHAPRAKAGGSHGSVLSGLEGRHGGRGMPCPYGKKKSDTPALRRWRGQRKSKALYSWRKRKGRGSPRRIFDKQRPYERRPIRGGGQHSIRVAKRQRGRRAWRDAWERRQRRGRRPRAEVQRRRR